MPSWSELLHEVGSTGGAQDVIRRKYLKELHALTNRNVIIYYSGWLEPRMSGDTTIPFGVNDSDKTGFMTAVHGLDRSKGLDLFLHTPGGGTAATESLVDYLRSMFGTDIRAIVPQIALSAGTMIALSCKAIIMGKHSSLGPIDPQIAGVAAHGIIEEFTRAATEIKADNSKIPMWQPIIAKYSPTLIGACEKAIAWSEEMVKYWLISGMFQGDPEGNTKADKIIHELGSHALTKSHDRHISINYARSRLPELNITALEDDQKFQEAVLSVHHACMLTLNQTPAYKIIENHDGVAFIQRRNPTLIVG